MRTLQLGWVIGLSLGLLGLCDPARAEPPAAPPVNFNIDRQPLGDAINAFAAQTGLQVLLRMEGLPRNLTAPRVAGALTPQAALTQLLEGSGLEYEYMDARTVAIRPAKSGVGTSPGSTSSRQQPNVALAAADGAPVMQKVPATEDSSVVGMSVPQSGSTTDDEGTEITVTGSRIRGLLGEQSIQPMLTITSKDIERYGVTSLGDIFAYIPQVTSFERGQIVQQSLLVGTPSANINSNRMNATLRGAPAGGTLLLINGRRLAKSGYAGGAGEGYDLGGIPLSAVERIDVLLDGASAIYGADALGGVINVILKKSYRGTEARAGYENTFDSDVGVKTFSLTHGFSSGKFSALVSGSREEANSLMWADRWFLRTFDRRFAGGSDLRSATAFAGRGVVSSISGNLPGLGTNRAAIPAGSSGVNLTIADYANAGPLPEILDIGQYARYSSPYLRTSASGSAEYKFNRAFTAFVDSRWGESSTWTSSLPVSSSTATVPAGAPGNPFGVPVRVSKLFYDLARPEQETVTVNLGLTAGVRGEFFRDWRYEAAAQQARSRPDVAMDGSVLDATRLATAFAGTNPPVLLYDSTAGASPNAPGTLEALTSPNVGAERSETSIYDAQADGTLFALPAGQVRFSFGSEYRDEHVDFPFTQAGLTVQSKSRYTLGYFAEMRMPLVSRQWGWPLLSEVQVSAAVRRDQYSDFPSSTNPRYGLLYRPAGWLMLRWSYGKGYKLPTLPQLYAPQSSGNIFPSAGTVFDALRGNQLVVIPSTGLPFTRRGNPDLRAERSSNVTAGAVLEIPFLDGLSFSVDYYDTKYLDRVGTLNLTDRIILFPTSIIRGANLSGDPAGWPGPVTGYQDITLNIASSRLAGFDFGVQYHRSTRGGDWAMKVAASKTTRNETRSAPTQPVVSLPTFSFPLQISGDVSWTRGAFSTGVLCVFRDAAFGTAVSGPMLPPATRWDWQGSYDFERGSWTTSQHDSWWTRALEGTRINVTVFNVFDALPPLRKGVFLPDNTVVDSRLRRYSINLVRQF